MLARFVGLKDCLPKGRGNRVCRLAAQSERGSASSIASGSTSVMVLEVAWLRGQERGHTPRAATTQPVGQFGGCVAFGLAEKRNFLTIPKLCIVHTSYDLNQESQCRRN